jgi:hypothetical protein
MENKSRTKVREVGELGKAHVKHKGEERGWAEGRGRGEDNFDKRTHAH